MSNVDVTFSPAGSVVPKQGEVPVKSTPNPVVVRGGHAYQQTTSTNLPVSQDFPQTPLESNNKTSSNWKVSHILVGAGHAVGKAVVNRMKQVGQNVFHELKKLGSEEGRERLAEQAGEKLGQIKNKVHEMKESSIEKIKEAKRTFPERLEELKNAPAAIKIAARKVGRSVLHVFRQLQSARGREELTDTMKDQWAVLKDKSVVLFKRGREKLGELKHNVKEGLDQYNELGKKDLALAGEKIDSMKDRAKGQLEVAKEVVGGKLKGIQKVAGEKLENLQSAAMKLESVAKSVIEKMQSVLSTKTQTPVGPSAHELFKELVAESKKLRNAETFEEFKLVINKKGHFQQAERSLGLESRQGTSANAKHTLETIIHVLQEGAKGGWLTNDDLNALAAMKPHLEKQMEAALNHNPDLRLELEQAFNDVEVNVIYGPVIQGTEEMLAHFDQNQAILFKVFDFVKPENGKFLIEGEVYSEKTIQGSADELRKSKEAYNKYLENKDKAAFRSNVANPKFSRVLKTGIFELLKAGIKKMDPDYKTSDHELSAEFREIEQMFKANAGKEGVPLDWNKLNQFIAKFGAAVDQFNP